jgi:hypothetical protein
LSAAGAAPAAADIAGDEQAQSTVAGEARINPPGYVWRSAVNVAEHGKRLEELWVKWKDKAVDGASDGVLRRELDPWQKFAHDIVAAKCAERQRKLGFRINNVPGYQPLRLLISGSAGTGKSRTIRSFVRMQHDLVRANGGADDVMKGSCLFAAPMLPFK